MFVIALNHSMLEISSSRFWKQAMLWSMQGIEVPWYTLITGFMQANNYLYSNSRTRNFTLYNFIISRQDFSFQRMIFNESISHIQIQTQNWYNFIFYNDYCFFFGNIMNIHTNAYESDHYVCNSSWYDWTFRQISEFLCITTSLI